MRTKTNDWYDSSEKKVYYGIDIYFNGEWHHAAEDNEPLLFETREERDAKRKELRKLKLEVE